MDKKQRNEMLDRIADLKPKRILFTPHLHKLDWSYNPRTKMLMLDRSWEAELNIKNPE